MSQTCTHCDAPSGAEPLCAACVLEHDMETNPQPFIDFGPLEDLL